MNTPSQRLSREAELDLIAKAKAGDDDAWVTLYEAHREFLTSRVRKFAGRFTEPHRNHAADLESEGVRAFAMAVAEFDPERGVRLVTLVGLLVRRTVLDYLARAMRGVLDDDGDALINTRGVALGDSPVDEPTNPEDSPDNVTDLSDLNDQLDVAIGACLSPQERFLLRARYVEGWTIDRMQATAYSKSVPRSRVHSDLDRALGKLRTYLTGAGSVSRA